MSRLEHEFSQRCLPIQLVVLVLSAAACQQPVAEPSCTCAQDSDCAEGAACIECQCTFVADVPDGVAGTDAVADEMPPPEDTPVPDACEGPDCPDAIPDACTEDCFTPQAHYCDEHCGQVDPKGCSCDRLCWTYGDCCQADGTKGTQPNKVCADSTCGECNKPCEPSCGPDCTDGCGGVCGGKPCDDGNACTKDDTCISDKCKGSLVNCDDGVACTVDSCGSAGACIHSALASLCDDADACTVDSCHSAMGCQHVTKSCDDGNACTTDGCDAANGACSTTPDNAAQPGTPCNAVPCSTVTAVCLAGAAECDTAADLSQDGTPCGDDSVCAGGACLKAICTPDAIDCAANTARKCQALGVAWIETPCGASASCKDGACVQHVCKAGEKTCSGSVVMQCDALGLAQVALLDCAESQLLCQNGGCVAPVCEPGTKGCNVNTARVCKPDSLGWQETPCAQGESCLGGDCKKQVCTPGAATCDGAKAGVCDALGLSEAVTVCTAGTHVCSQGECLALVCKPGEAVCKDTATINLCNADALGWTSTACKATESCKLAQCLPRVCTPDTAVCNGSKRVVCDSLGLSQTVAADCATTGKICSKGICLDPVCQAGEKACTGKVVRTCAPDRLGWIEQPCVAGWACQAGACIAEACVPESVYCSAGHVLRCDAAGVSVVVQEDCFALGKACFGGACVAAACKPQDDTCDGKTAKQCNLDLLGIRSISCPDACVGGACVTPICKAGTTSCMGTHVLACDATGAHAALTVDCAASGKACVAGACTTPTCKPGDGKCDADLHSVCANDGVTWVPSACGSGEICLDGACTQAVCAPGKLFCQGTLVSQCDDTGKSATLIENCAPKGQICADGKCAIAACIPGTKQCKGGNLAVCKEDASGWQVAQSCADSNACTVDDCDPKSLQCVHFAPPCDDGDPCTADTCSGGKCKSTAVSGSACDDGSACTTLDLCVAGSCTAPLVARVVTLVGNGQYGDANGTEDKARFYNPRQLARMADGSFLVADAGNDVIRRWIPGVGVSTFAGSGYDCQWDGPAFDACFQSPWAVAVGGDGTVYVASGSALRRIVGGMVTTVTSAGPLSNGISNVRIAPDGLVIVESWSRLFAVSPDGTVAPWFGATVTAAAPTEGPASDVAYDSFIDYDWAADGTFYFTAERDYNRSLYRRSPGGLVTKVVDGADGGVAVVKDQSVWFGQGRSVRRLPRGGVAFDAAGLAGSGGLLDGDFTAARFAGYLYRMLAEPDGSVLTVDTSAHAIRRVVPLDNGCDDGDACTADSCGTDGVCAHAPLDAGETCDDGNPCTSAEICGKDGCGGGKTASCDDGNPCTSDGCDPWTGKCENAPHRDPCAGDDACQVAMACSEGKCVQGVPRATAVAGNETQTGFVDGKGTKARFKSCNGATRLPDGTLVVSDSGNKALRKVLSDGMVVTLGDASAKLWEGPLGFGQVGPTNGITADRNGVLWFSTATRIGRVLNDHVQVVCGTDQAGFADGSCTEAKLANPSQLAADGQGKIYVADRDNHRVRVYAGGGIATLAGDGVAGYLDGPAALARFNKPIGVAVAKDGTVYVGDQGNGRVRAIKNGTVTTVAGGGSLKDGPAPVAQMDLAKVGPLAVGPDGVLYVGNIESVWRVTGGFGTRIDVNNTVGGLAAHPDGSVAIATATQVLTLGAVVRLCDDGSSCTIDQCDTATGGCKYALVPGKADCDDGDACTQKDACSPEGTCVGTASKCEDGLPCTDDLCDPSSGECSHQAVPGACEDGSLCTTADHCAQGQCETKTESVLLLAGGSHGETGRRDGPGPQARFDSISRTCMDGAGNIFLLDDASDARLRKVAPDGTTTTIATTQIPDPSFLACNKAGIQAIANDIGVYVPAEYGAWKMLAPVHEGGPKPGGPGVGTAGKNCPIHGQDDGSLLTWLNDIWAAKTTLYRISPNGTVTSLLTTSGFVVLESLAGSGPAVYASAGGNLYSYQDGKLSLVGSFVSTGQIGVAPGGDVLQATLSKLYVFHPATKKLELLGGGGSGEIVGPLSTANFHWCGVVGAPTDTRTVVTCGSALYDVRRNPPQCNDGNPCTADTCDPATGACKYGPAAGSCASDGNPCTNDVCQAGECAHVSNLAACDDADGCTVADTCSGGVCAGVPKKCPEESQMCISGTCKPLFTGTQILTLADQQQLNTWAGVAASHVWKQCYGADGSWGTGTALHNACWGKGPAITIIKSGGHVFGAYQYEPWARSTDPWNPLLYGKDPKAFLFSLDQKAKLPVEAPGTYAYWAFYTGDGKAPGPKFGQGDLTIAANLATGTSNLGVTYDTKSLPCLYACGTYFTGEGSFPVHRIEVYWW